MIVYILSLPFDSLGLRFVGNYPISASYGIMKPGFSSGNVVNIILPLGGFYYIIDVQNPNNVSITDTFKTRGVVRDVIMTYYLTSAVGKAGIELQNGFSYRKTYFSNFPDVKKIKFSLDGSFDDNRLLILDSNKFYFNDFPQYQFIENCYQKDSVIDFDLSSSSSGQPPEDTIIHKVYLLTKNKLFYLEFKSKVAGICESPSNYYTANFNFVNPKSIIYNSNFNIVVVGDGDKIYKFSAPMYNLLGQYTTNGDTVISVKSTSSLIISSHKSGKIRIFNINLNLQNEFQTACSYIRDFFFYNNILYLSCSSENESKFLIYTNFPSNPTLSTNLKLPQFLRKGTYNNGKFFLISKNEIYIIDEQTLKLISKYEGLQNGNSLFFFNSKLFVSDSNNVLIIDISNPSNPSLITTINLGNNFSKDIWVNGNIAYIIGNKLLIYDLDNYQILSTLSFPTTSTEIYLYGQNLYVAGGDSGLLIVDISNINNPTILSNYKLNNAKIEDVVVNNDRAYLAYGDSGLKILDVSNPNNPQLINTLNNLGYVSKLDVKYGYLSIGTSLGLFIYRITDNSLYYYRPNISYFPPISVANLDFCCPPKFALFLKDAGIQIYDLPVVNLSQNQNKAPFVYKNGKVILKEVGKFEIYSINGQKVITVYSNGNNYLKLKKGVYIIIYKNKSYKLIIWLPKP